MERWVLKVRGLEERKRHYEEILRRELNGLDEEFSTLKLLTGASGEGECHPPSKRQPKNQRA